MTDPKNDPAAVEAVSEAVFVHKPVGLPWGPSECGCGESFPTAVERQRHAASAAVTAALPALRRQITEEIAAWADDLAAGVINRDKPYNRGFIHASETLARHVREIGAQ